jgi:membrane-bound lytic murein transglycosylase D
MAGNAPVVTSTPPRPIEVRFTDDNAEQARLFLARFRIGRDASCDLRLRNDYVSRVHAEVAPEGKDWRIRDLNSSNGLFCNGARVDNVLITGDEVVRLGIEGIELAFHLEPVPEPEPEPPPPPPPPPILLEPVPVSAKTGDAAGKDPVLAHYVNRYFTAPAAGEAVGEHTMFIRAAFAEVQTQQKKVHRRQRTVLLAVIVVLAIAAIAISAYTYRLRQEARKQRELAHNLFYAMKSLDVDIAQAERLALSTDPQHGAAAVRSYEARRQQMQANYDQFLASLHIYDAKTTEQHRLILRVARIFGECELDMPPDFENEILKYIKYWQSTGRFARDIQVAKQKGLTEKIPKALLERGLPVQFFYLAMQESDFDAYRSGPLTRKGYAKGMWQFIPETAVKYGLHLGPLVDLDRPDPGDERDQADKATDAASRYIEMLYSTDAQASGLLVMACYNWGEDNVLPLVRSMPANPRERNFWRLLANHSSQIPQETYDYVFYITAAAVIGENPRLFGFDFDNPLTNSL